MTYNDEILEQIDERHEALRERVTHAGTVVEVISAVRAMVAVDGSAVAARVKVFGGVKLAAGDRVGLVKFGTDWAVVGSFTARNMLARARRTSNSSTATTTLVGVLRLDDVPVVPGRAYKIWTTPLGLFSSAANDTVAARLHYTTDGSTPSSSSPTLAAAQGAAVTVANGLWIPMTADYYPATGDTLLSLWLGVIRAAGSGNVFIAGSAAFPLSLVVEDNGLDVGDTGVIL